ncbi:unnamed protein product [Linum tenue]|uniref:Peptidase S54 rhomboid domain-containing protein n=1 Tax=Linum tenue TaxID=586396 RepID=A0AAV0LZW4_9ROSI|nr:unnamed protein product [Linum tenue]
MMGSSLSSSAAGIPPWWVQFDIQKAGVSAAAISLRTTAGSFRIDYLLRSFFKKFPHLNHIPRVKDLWCEKASQIQDFNLLKTSNDLFASTSAYCLCLLHGTEEEKNSGTKKQTHSETSGRKPSGGRLCTNVLLAVNVLVFAAQIATDGKLLFMGAKVNSLIDRGEIWRLVTSSFLHSGFLHLMVNSWSFEPLIFFFVMAGSVRLKCALQSVQVNCYSLNSVGPTIESLIGPKRFLAVYFTSAIASSATSYWLCKGPSVGASGAVFGLVGLLRLERYETLLISLWVGSLAVYVMRHKTMIRGGKQELQYIAQMILLNMVIGLLNPQIDNWGHVIRRVVGGIATSWVVGPAWTLDYLSKDGRRVFIDRAPLKSLTTRKRNGVP